jgi:hypothetical protein
VAGKSGQPGRSVTSKDRCDPCRTALPVPFSRVCGTTLGRGTASRCACQRHAWTARNRTRTMPDGGWLLVTNRGRRQLDESVRTVEHLVAASRPDKREARLKHARRIHRSASKAGPRTTRTRPELVPRGPSPFSSTPHKRPHRPDDRHRSLSPHLRHLPGSRLLPTYHLRWTWFIGQSCG